MWKYLLLSLGLAATTACSSAAPSPDLDVVDKPDDEAPKNGRDRSSGTMKGIGGQPIAGKEETLPGAPAPAPSSSAPSSDPKGGGSTPPPSNPPSVTAPEYPFRALDVRHPIAADVFVTQCKPDGSTQLVWKTTATGPDAYSRFADPKYMQQPGVFVGCGSKTSNDYPLVFAVPEADLPMGAFVAKCVKTGEAHVYQVKGMLEGKPMATFQYPEPHPACP